MSDTTLIDIQADIVDRLLSDDYFDDISVLSERVNEFDYEVQLALGIVTGRAGKCGALVIVQQPTAVDEMPNVLFGPLDTEWTVLVLEEAKINRAPETGTGKPALAIARRVARVLKLTHFGGSGRLLRPGSPLITPAEALIDVGGEYFAPVAYAVKFNCSEADSDAFTKVARPAISPAGGSVSVSSPATVTLTCSTNDSSIWYSTDGSYPRPGGPGSSEYSAAFDISEECQLRVAATKFGSIPSDVVAADFTEA